LFSISIGFSKISASTMANVAIALGDRSPAARLLAISRGGLLPRAHLLDVRTRNRGR
jgi:hypothetical protein